MSITILGILCVILFFLLSLIIGLVVEKREFSIIYSSIIVLAICLGILFYDLGAMNQSKRELSNQNRYKSQYVKRADGTVTIETKWSLSDDQKGLSP